METEANSGLKVEELDGKQEVDRKWLDKDNRGQKGKGTQDTIWVMCVGVWVCSTGYTKIKNCTIYAEY